MCSVKEVKFTACLFLLYATLAYESAFALQPPKGVIPQDGRPALPLKLKNLDDEAFDLATVKGKWAFVHFWASWCGPCRKEMPTIRTLAEKTADLPLEIVLVNTAETEDTVFTFLATLVPDLIPLMDVDGRATEQWQPRGLPSTYLVDPQGRIRYLVLGGRDWAAPEYVTFIVNLVKSEKP